MVRVQITNKNAADALTRFALNPDITDAVLAKLPDTMGRSEAEDVARRVSLSTCLCLEVGLTAEQDATLFLLEHWQELLGKLLRIYDTTDRPEVEP